MLPKRPLGQTGIRVSILGLGTVKLGRNQAVKYPAKFEIPDDNQAKELIALARDNGINLIDTAPAYGASEQRLGYLLKGQRRHWVICTKVGEDFSQGVSSYNFTPEHTIASIERSLLRLDTDVLDLVLVHSDGDDLAIINNYGTLEALAQLKQQGKIRAYGMSTKTVAGGLLAAQKSDAVMVTWNLQDQAQLPVIDYCQQHHKGVLIKKALASGHLASTDKAKKTQVAGRHNSLVENSLAIIMDHPGVSSVIIGTLSPQHLQANVDSVRSMYHL
jgi:aryl-alcohol dehydrogenase-like predicted oxidoreductase